MKIIENPLDGSKSVLNKSITVDGTEYHLLFSKEKRGRNDVITVRKDD